MKTNRIKSWLLVRAAMIAALLGVATHVNAEDKFYLSDFEIAAGETKQLAIQFETDNVNSADPSQLNYVAFQFDLYVPEGLTIVQKKGKPNFTFNADRMDDHTFSSATQADGALRVLSASLTNASFWEKTGDFILFSVTAAEDFTGNHELAFKNIMFSTADGSRTELADVTTKVTGPAAEDPTVAVTGITLDKSTAELTEGESVTLVATVAPDNATDKTVTWTTSDASVATVTNGVVTAVKAGNATITAKAGDKSATCTIAVNAKVISVTGITLDKTTAVLTEGETVTLVATVAPDNATDKTVTWTTSDASVATVTNGVVTAVKAGNATITAKAGDKSATCTIAVNAKVISVTGITLDKTTAVLTEGETVTLVATVAPDNATDKTVTWTTSDASVATVTNGVVTAVKAGSATITAKAGDKSAICAVTVKAKEVVTNDKFYLSDFEIVAGETKELAIQFESEVADNYVAFQFDITVPAGLTIEQKKGKPNFTFNEERVDDHTFSSAVQDDGSLRLLSASLTNACFSGKSGDFIHFTVSAAEDFIGEYEITLKNIMFSTAAGTRVELADVIAKVTAKEQPKVSISEGDYYMKNVASGKFLVGANDWGTRASLGKHGIKVTLYNTENGKFLIDTHIANSETNHYLGSNGYVDAEAAEWIITESAEGVYAMSLDGANYWGYDGVSTILTGTLTDATQPNAQWQLVTRAEMEAALTGATESNPVDATFYIQAADFSRNDPNIGGWQGGPAIGGWDSNKNAEKWNEAPFDVYQEVTNLPNGYYRLSAQGYYRIGSDGNDASVAAEQYAAGTPELNAYLYGNDAATPLKSIVADAKSGEAPEGNYTTTSIGYVPQGMDGASAFFSEGLYHNELVVKVTDGTLRLGVKKEVASHQDWTIFDNFELYYLGTDYTLKPILVTSIILNEKSAILEVGNTLELTAYAVPYNAENRSVTWSSSNESSITVDANGMVTAVKGGVAIITATANDGSGVTATCRVVCKADGIEDVEADMTQWPADIYDLTGRQVKQAATSLEGLQKGIYLIQGRKVLVK